MRDEPAARAAAGEGRQAPLDEILPVLVDTGTEDEMAGGLLRNTIGMKRLRAAPAQQIPRLPRDNGPAECTPRRPRRERAMTGVTA